MTGSGDPRAAVFVALTVPQAVQVSVNQYEALQEAAEWRHVVAAALASVRAEGLEPGHEDLGRCSPRWRPGGSTDELRERVLSRYRR